MRAVAILAVVVFAPLTDVVTQEQPLQPGQRVRVTQVGREMVGSVITADAAHLVINANGTPFRIGIQDIRRVQLSVGQRGTYLLPVLVGALAGSAGGWAIAHLADPQEGCVPIGFGFVECEDSGSEGMGLLIGLMAGIAGGVVLGSKWKRDRWQEVPLDRLRVSVVPQCDGFGIGASIAF